MADDTRLCGRCELQRPLTDFYVRRNGTVNSWCKECYRAWHRHRYTPQDGASDLPRACAQCGSRYQPKTRTTSAYCSRACKTNAHDARSKAERLASKAERMCLFCGGVILQSARSDAVFCSARCNEKAHGLQRKLRARTGQSDKPGYLRAEICERDGWRCHICHQPVDRTLVYPDLLCPSLDHVIPVSHGGGNNPDNLRLAHLVCNLRRGVTPCEDIATELIEEADATIKSGVPLVQTRRRENPASLLPTQAWPCARCHESERVPGKSYCKPCVSAWNKEAREARKQRELVVDPHRYDPASGKPCNRCGEAPREVSSYCRPCLRLFRQESYARCGGKRKSPHCSRCGKPRDGQHPSYCLACHNWRRWSDCLKRKHGITGEDYERLLENQGSCCAVCARQLSGHKGHRLDQDYVAGRIREIICDGCSSLLRTLPDDTDLLIRAIAYKKKWK